MNDANFDSSPDIITAEAQGRLKSIIERVERLEEDKAAVLTDIKEVLAEAKGEGFDTKIIKRIVALRRIEKAKREEEAAILDLYMVAIGEA